MKSKRKATLLDKAISVPRLRRKNVATVTTERTQVALAWASDKITLTQASVAFDCKPPECYRHIAFLLKSHIQQKEHSKKTA